MRRRDALQTHPPPDFAMAPSPSSSTRSARPAQLGLLLLLLLQVFAAQATPVGSALDFLQYFRGTLQRAEDLREEVAEQEGSGWQPAQVQDSPHHAALRVARSPSQVSSCAGSLVHERWVLSSAGCIEGGAYAVVRLGATFLNVPQVIVETRRLLAHPAFDPSSLANDLGLLDLGRRVALSDRIQPIRIQSSHQAQREWLEEAAALSGFAAASAVQGRNPGERLHQISLAIISNVECFLGHGANRVRYSTICTRAAPRVQHGVCAGDSGSGLVLRDEDGYGTLVGVLSFGHPLGCSDDELPTGYTRPGYFHQWIENTADINLDWIPNVPTSSTTSTTTTPETTTPEEITEGTTPDGFTEATTPDEVTEETTPEEITESPTPEENTEGTTPEENTEGTTPDEVTEETTPEEVTEETTPEEITESPTPEENTEGTTPEENTEGTTPDEVTEETTPEEVTEETTPEEITESPTPEENTEGTTPEENTEGTTPDEVIEETTPEEVTEETTPEEITESPTPEENTEGTTPEQITEGTTPEQITEGTTPEQITEGTTPEQITEGTTPEQITEGTTPEEITKGNTPKPRSSFMEKLKALLALI